MTLSSEHDWDVIFRHQDMIEMLHFAIRTYLRCYISSSGHGWDVIFRDQDMIEMLHFVIRTWLRCYISSSGHDSDVTFFYIYRFQLTSKDNSNTVLEKITYVVKRNLQQQKWKCIIGSFTILHNHVSLDFFYRSL